MAESPAPAAQGSNSMNDQNYLNIDTVSKTVSKTL